MGKPTMLNASRRLMLRMRATFPMLPLLVTKMLGCATSSSLPAEKAGDAPVWLSAAYRDAEGRQWKVLRDGCAGYLFAVLQVATI